MKKVDELQSIFFELSWVERIMPHVYRIAVSASILIADDAAILSLAFIQ